MVAIAALGGRISATGAAVTVATWGEFASLEADQRAVPLGVLGDPNVQRKLQEGSPRSENFREQYATFRDQSPRS